MYIRTFSCLALILADKKVLKEVAYKLKSNILEGKSWAVKQLKQVVLVL